MTLVRKRRPGTQPVSYEPSERDVKKTKAFNDNLRYVQGFRTSVGANSNTTIDIDLNAPGRKLLGVAFMPSVKTADISDVEVTLIVNNNNVLLKMGAANANPLDTQGMIFFPVPQPLYGNDTITLSYTNQSGINLIIHANVFYVPRQKGN